MDETHERFKSAILDQIQSTLAETETEDRAIRVKKVHVPKLRDPEDMNRIRQARVGKRSYADRVYADLEIVDKTNGRVLNSGKVHLGNIPVKTPFKNYLVDGHWYQGSNQAQLKGTAYTKEKQSGEVSSQFRLERGRNFDIEMNPETEEFQLAVGKSTYPLLPFLKELGVSDSQIKQAWSEKMREANVVDEGAAQEAITKFAKKVFYDNRTQGKSYDELRDMVRQHFLEEAEMNPEATKMTLGKAYEHPDGEAMLDATKKIVGVHREEVESDAPDEIYFKRFRSMEETGRDWMERAKPDIQRKLRRRIARDDVQDQDVNTLIDSSIFDTPLKSYFTTSKLQGAGENTNVLDLLSNDSKVTLMGEGGISNRHILNNMLSARDVHMSAMGFIDPVKTSQGSAGVSEHLALGSQIKDGKIWSEFLNTRTGNMEEKTPEDLYEKTVAFPDEIIQDGNTWQAVGDDGYVKAVRKGKMVEVKPDAVDYVMPESNSLYSEVTNLIPFLNSNSGGRAILGTQQITQAVPLKEPDAPLVRGNNFEELPVFALGANSPVDGEVTSVSKHRIIVKDASGEKHKVPLYSDLPLNNNAFLNSKPLVSKGDTVQKGQPLADNPFTKNGTLALGKDLNVMIGPWKGYNYEDGIVVSEDAAKKLTSEHLYDMGDELDKNSELDPGRFATYGQKYKIRKEVESNTDAETGLIKPGTTVQKGDVLARVVQKRPQDPEDNILKTLSKSLVKPYRAKPITWDHDVPGKVIESKKRGNQISLLVKTEEPARIADKVADRAGHKGVITCYDDQTEILTEEGWVYFKELPRDVRVATMDENKNAIFDYPEKYIEQEYVGSMYGLKTERIDYLVSPNHRMFCRPERNKNGYKVELAEEMHGKRRYHCVASQIQHINDKEKFIEIDNSSHSGRQCKSRFLKKDFYRFLGWFLSEGSLAYYSNSRKKVKSYKIQIAQLREVNPEYCNEIEEILDNMGVGWNYNGSQYTFSNKALYYYLKPLGGCSEKYIPRELFNTSPEHLKSLLTAYQRGDGSRKKSHYAYRTWTTSKQLAEDFSEIGARLGQQVILYPIPEEDVRGNKMQWALVFHENRPEAGPGVASKNYYKTEYSGKIYCVQVPRGLVYIRRNGKPMWSGNSIIPQNEVPYDKETGEPVDVIIDPSSIPSRVNVGQLMEMAAGKVAKKKGQPYIAKTHGGEDNVAKLKQEMDELGISDKTTVVDPKSGKEIPNVNVGPKNIMKLRHMVEKKMSSRSHEDAYDMDKQPIKGRSIDNLTFYAMVGHGGAKKNLAEMSNLKVTENPEWWAQYESGAPVVLPKEPTYQWQKFEGMLKGMGINVRHEGDKMMMQPLTDKETLDMAKKPITSVDVVRKKDLRGAPGGIFDPSIIGEDMKQWSRIELPERVINPVFLKAASKVTEITQKDLEAIVKGEKTYEGKTGEAAVDALMDKIDVEQELQRTQERLDATSSDATRDKLNQKMRYLRGLKKFSMSPKEAYTMKQVPVLPGVFRQPVELPDGNMVYPAANYNYQDLANLTLNSWSSAAKSPREKVKNQVRSDIYDGVKAVTGMGEPLTNAEAKGLMKEITGKPTKAQARRGISRQSKEGFYQRKVFRKRQGQSGGSVITVEPDLSVDELGVPEDMAWDIFRPMVIRRLRQQQGMSIPEARRHIEDRTEVARTALEKEMDDRPVFANRHPSWQKQNIIASKPKLVPGKEIRVPNLPINTYLGGDFDGDQFNIHVPITDEAVAEAKNMLPSKLYHKSGSGTIMLKPQDSALAGLYDLTKSPDETYQNPLNKEAADIRVLMGIHSRTHTKIAKDPSPVESYTTNPKDPGKSIRDQIKQDLDEGVRQITDWITYKMQDGSTREGTVGQALVNLTLPGKYFIEGQADKKKIDQVLKEISQDDDALLAPAANELSRLGFDHATYMGLSMGLDDLDVQLTKPRQIADTLHKRVRKVDAKDIDPKRKEEMKRKLFTGALEDMDKEIITNLPKGNMFRLMAESGAKGNPTQLRQIVGPPTLFQRSGGREIFTPVKDSFAHGLNPAEYYIQQTGGRMGLIQRSTGVQKPGEIGKDLLAMNVGNVIEEEDCGTQDGIWVPVNRRDAAGRYLASDTKKGIGDRNELVSEAMIRELAQKDIEQIHVRSPLTCKAKTGVCKKCYGLRPGGREPHVGDPVGVDDSQGVVDRIANLALKSWHLSGGKEVSELPFDRYQRLTNMSQNVPDKAVLAQESGKIQKIDRNDLGGWDVYIDDIRHRIPKNLGIKSQYKQTGTQVQKGEQLSVGMPEKEEKAEKFQGYTGNVKPQELLELRGIKPTQEYMVNEMADIFDSDTHGGIDRKSLENLVSSMTGLAEVREPGDSDYVERDIGPANDMEYFNRNREERVPLKEAVGYPLAEGYGSAAQVGDVLTREQAKQLWKQGDRKVKIAKRPVVFEPILKPAQFVPEYKNDWMSRLTQKRLKKTILDSAAAGNVADLHGPDPIPAYVYGTDTTEQAHAVNY